MAILRAWPRILTRVYREQIQQVGRAGLQLGASNLQVQRANRSVTPPSFFGSVFWGRIISTGII